MCRILTDNNVIRVEVYYDVNSWVGTLSSGNGDELRWVGDAEYVIRGLASKLRRGMTQTAGGKVFDL